MTTTDMTLHDVKAGDRIILERTESGRTTARAERVEQATKQRIQAGCSWRKMWFTRKTGLCVIGQMNWVRYVIRPPHPGELERMDADAAKVKREAEERLHVQAAHEASEAHRLADSIDMGHEQWEQLPIETLREIAGLIGSAKP